MTTPGIGFASYVAGPNIVNEVADLCSIPKLSAVELRRVRQRAKMLASFAAPIMVDVD